MTSNKFIASVVTFAAFATLSVLVFHAGGFKWGTPNAGAMVGFSGFVTLFFTALALRIPEDKS